MLLEGFSPVIWETDAQGGAAFHQGEWGNGEELKGYGWVAKVHPEDRERAVRIWRLSFASHRTLEAEYRAENKNGEYRWIGVRASPVFNHEGAVVKYVGMNIDIDARKRAEQALIDSEARARMLLEGFSPIYWETDATGSAMVIRSSWDEPHTAAHSDKLGKGWVESIHPDDRDAVISGSQQIVAAQRP